MSFFYVAAKKEGAATKAAPKPTKARRADIPIASLRQLGCSVCPRDKDEAKLTTPKMRPAGSKSAPVYLLGTSPSEGADRHDDHWEGKAGKVIVSKFGSRWMDDNIRSNFITQCAGDQTTIEIECCRNRIVADIEAVKPLIIVTVGDPPLQWATGLENGNAKVHRGTIFVAKIGNHSCYVIPLMYPAFAYKKSYRKSEYEMAMEHDVRLIKDLTDQIMAGQWLPAETHSAPFDKGIEIITGNEPGDMQRLERALARLALARESGLDFETNGLRPYFLKDPKIWMVAVGTFEDTVAFPLDHPEGWGTEARRAQVWGMFINYLLISGKKACHNLAMEMEWLTYFVDGKILRLTEWDDTMAMAHSLDERPGTKSLEVQTVIRFGFNLKKQSNLDVKRILEYPLKEALRYCAMDTKWTNRLRDVLKPLLKAEPRAGMAEYLRKLRLAPTLVLTETAGLPADMKYAAKMKAKLEDELSNLEKDIRRCKEILQYSARFGSFSPTNPDHVLKLMKDLLQRPEVRVEDRNGIRYTTEEEALATIPPEEVPSAALILEHRGAAKLLSTYVEPVISGRIICADGLIRTKYSSMVAVTGRLASEDPNIQNFPARKHKEIRGIIYALEGDWFVAADYGQIEFRVVGMASEDPNLVKYCWTGYDVHKFWAERMLSVYPEIKDWIVTEFADDIAKARKKQGKDFDEDKFILKLLRQESKNKWVFPQLFGSSLQSCANNLHLPDWAAQELGDEFWDEFKVVKVWQDKLLVSYEKKGYVETLGGRRRRGPMSKNEIINMPIQGTACDIVTEAMCVLSERSQEEDDPYINPKFNGHDDLSFLIPDQILEPKLEIISREMCLPRFDYINVPLVLEIKVGPRWSELEEIKVYRSNEVFGHRNPYA